MTTSRILTLLIPIWVEFHGDKQQLFKIMEKEKWIEEDWRNFNYQVKLAPEPLSNEVSVWMNSYLKSLDVAHPSM